MWLDWWRNPSFCKGEFFSYRNPARTEAKSESNERLRNSGFCDSWVARLVVSKPKEWWAEGVVRSNSRRPEFCVERQLTANPRMIWTNNSQCTQRGSDQTPTRHLIQDYKAAHETATGTSSLSYRGPLGRSADLRRDRVPPRVPTSPESRQVSDRIDGSARQADGRWRAPNLCKHRRI